MNDISIKIIGIIKYDNFEDPIDESRKLEMIMDLYDPYTFDVNYNDDILLRSACLFNYLEIAKWLYDHGANIHSKDDFVLHLACKIGNLRFAKWLYSLDYFDISKNIDYLFRNACSTGLTDMAEWLYQISNKKIDINAYDGDILNDICDFFKRNMDYKIYKNIYTKQIFIRYLKLVEWLYDIGLNMRLCKPKYKDIAHWLHVLVFLKKLHKLNKLEVLFSVINNINQTNSQTLCPNCLIDNDNYIQLGCQHMICVDCYLNSYEEEIMEYCPFNCDYDITQIKLIKINNHNNNQNNNINNNHIRESLRFRLLL